MTEWIITSSVLILTIFALRFLLRGKISLKLQYALWLLVAMRLLLPFSLFESPASVMNAVPEPPKIIYNGMTPETEYNMPADFTPASPFAPPGDATAETDINISHSSSVTEPTVSEFDWGEAAKTVWLLGIAVTATIFLASNLRFSAALLRSRRKIEAEGCALPVYVSGAVKTPCLFGLFRPSVYLTEEVLCDEHVLRHVLAHERTHFSHRDHIWALVRCACIAIHWYNPLVWLAAFFSLRDAELACDEDTIKKIGENERTEYGRTLIGLACGRPAAGILHTATTMTGSKSGIKERIALIAKRPKMLWWTAAAVVLIAVLAAACTFTGASTKADADEVIELTAEQIDEVNAAFAPETTDENGIPTATPISCFFTSYYTKPQDIDLAEFLRCCPIAGTVSSQAELEELRTSEYYPLGSAPLGAADRPVNKFTAGSVNLLLQQYTGVSLSELIDAGKSSEELIYVEKYDSYYNFFAKDLYPGTFNCTRGEIEGDEIRLYSDLADGNTALLTLRKEGENYLIVSHVLTGITADRTAENKEATEVPESADPLTEKYYNYFGSELLYIMNEDPYDQSKIGFTDEQISVFAYLTALRENPGYDSPAGVQRDYFDEICEKHFGRTVTQLDNRLLITLENGNIASTGWGPSGAAYVLNSIYELDGGIKKATFFEISLDAAAVEAFYGKYPDGDLSSALLDGQFEDFGAVSLVELRFTEHVDENGNFYVEYISANRLGTTKSTDVYRSVPSDPLFETEIPSLTGSGRSGLPLREEELSVWCAEGGEEEFISVNYAENYDSIPGGPDPARLIYNVTDNFRAAISQRSFSSLSNADYEYLLYTALFRTPAVSADSENIKGSALEKISEAFENWAVSDFVYVSDVEKTFRYLFGDEIRYVPKNLREFGWRYIEEADVYIRLEHQGLSLNSAGYPLVVAVRQSGDLCEIDAFLGLISPDDESIAFYSGASKIEYSKDNLAGLYLSQKLYTYAFRKADDGRFILQSVYAKAPQSLNYIYSGSGKVGLETGGLVESRISPVYDAIELKCTEDGTFYYEAMVQSGTRRVVDFGPRDVPFYKEVPKNIYHIYNLDGTKLVDMWCNDYRYAYGMLYTVLDDSPYAFEIENGRAVQIGEPSPAEVGTSFGYTLMIKAYYPAYHSFYGVKDSDGKVIVEPMYTVLRIPFADRIVASEGASAYQALDCGRAVVFDSDGNKVSTDEFNALYYHSFGDGTYIGVGVCLDTGDIQCLYSDGTTKPAGFWFVDKNGNAVSECFSSLSIMDSYALSVDSKDVEVTATNSGRDVVFPLSDYILPEK
ncbi:MAG: M56 family metallopeptidase [Oscillospiraceae bacterium]